MFQNETIAKNTGRQVANTLIGLGMNQETAKDNGQEAEARLRASLNKWTRENVGLD